MKITKKVQKTLKTIFNFLNQTHKNYKSMKTKISKIWLFLCIATIMAACNVTRVITNESQYYQKGDTAVTIQTKTIESYNAVKNY